MKKHVLRPLWVAIGVVVLALIARQFLVPSDFGVHGKSFTYSFYRLGNIEEWQNFTVKYRGQAICADCHEENSSEHAKSKHAVIQCENCHGPALDHPDKPEKLVIERDRALCLRCHASLPYPTSLRASLPAIDPQNHNPDMVCIECHNPHKPDLEDM